MPKNLKQRAIENQKKHIHILRSDIDQLSTKLSFKQRQYQEAQYTLEVIEKLYESAPGTK